MTKHNELKASTIIRFEKKLIKKPNGCIEWGGYCLNRKWSNYGIITMNRKQYRTHRFAWLLYVWNIPNNMCVLHVCDNMRCVNIKHLFLGTRLDNNLDRDIKKRNKSPSGSKNGQSKLCELDVIRIKSLINNNLGTYASIGKRFGVSYQAIQAIAKGKSWKKIN